VQAKLPSRPLLHTLKRHSTGAPGKISVVSIPALSACSVPVNTMQVDMTLASSYKPVLVCIAKVCTLMVFHYSSMALLFVTERYAIMLAVLYIDQWIACEYLVNTNSVTVVLAISLLVHELRDAGVQERLHGELSHTVVLAMLVVSNIVVLTCGETLSFLPQMSSLSPTISSVSAATTATNIKENERFRVNHFNPGSVQSNVRCGAFTYMLLTCVLLIVLSTCAMPVSTHDPVLINLRVWSFTALSMMWFYTVDYKQLRYSSVASFTPCVLRFSCVLFLTPTPMAIVGIVLMGVCLAVTHSWPGIGSSEITSHHQQNTIHTLESVHHSVSKVGRMSGVVRKESPGSMISYRAPSLLCDEAESLSNVSASVSGSGAHVGTGASGNTHLSANESVIDVKNGDIINDEEEVDGEVTNKTFVDYNSLFQQVLSQQGL
jgi:hypothetical protein